MVPGPKNKSQEIGLARKPAGQHFLHVTGEAWQSPDPVGAWGGASHWVVIESSSVKNLGGQCFKSTAGFILILSVTVLFTPFSNSEIAGSHVYLVDQYL